MEEQLLQNIKTMDSHYNDDISYRKCLRKIFEMNEKTPHLEIDDITNDENNYDEESMFFMLYRICSSII